MAKRAWLVSVSVILEMDEEDAGRFGAIWQAEDALTRAVLSALSSQVPDQPGTTVELQSLSSTPLVEKPPIGRCTVCKRWVHDVENPTSEHILWGLGRGAVLEGRLLCDDHLPKDHPVAF
jgi:hypothetical protein